MTVPEAAPAGPSPAGWYEDPNSPGRDRWWNGYQWTSATAKTPRASWLGPDLERMQRPGLNVMARVAAILTSTSAGLLLLFLILILAAPLAPVWTFQLLLALAFLTALAALGTGINALRHVRTLGGRGAAWQAIATGAFLSLFLLAVGATRLVL